ncbi:O-antigen ligase C-terminal domain-containing protein [Glaciecola sp. MH2013]|uniref:PglL family O-oligosaccharyltransferase n=1 Tax=Glaciecola sp. MH2013 TaxID=2785524 RepID=UPI00189F927D|nr:O-antigen ligase family protein [Glaciecola sp. MH2013]MBF7072416.1 O-antigen ligase C-terminal domain-containing protein [Glaciecola sp. MH2013]
MQPKRQMLTGDLPSTIMLFTVFVTFVIAMNYSGEQIGGYGLELLFNNSVWIAYVLIVLLGVCLIIKKAKVRLSNGFVYLVLFSIPLFIPSLFSFSDLRYESILIYGAIIAAFLLIFVIEQFKNKNFTRRLLFILLCSSIIQTVFGLYQYYFIFDSSFLFPHAETHAKPYGIFLQINVFSTYLAFGSLLSIYFLFSAKKQTKALIIFTFVLVILNAHLSMLAETKTGRVVPLIALAIYLGYFSWKRHHKTWLLTSLLFLFAALVSFTPKQWFDVRPSQVVEAPIGIQSLGMRPLMYKVGIEIVIDNPVSGIGMGELPREFNFRKAELLSSKQDLKRMTAIANHIHNEPLQWMIELGVFSLVSFVGIFGVWVVGLFKGWYDISILLLALPFIGHTMLELPFYNSAPHLLAFATILALANKKTLKLVHFPSSIGWGVVPILSAISFKVIAFFILSISSNKILKEYRMTGERNENLLYAVEPTIGFERFFTHEKFQWELKRAVKKGAIDQALVFNYIVFLENIRMQWPEAIIYIQLAEMYLISGQNQKALEIMEEGYLFFPLDEKVTELYKQLKG